MTADELNVLEMLMVTLGKCTAERRVLITIAQDAGIPNLEDRLAHHRESPQYQLLVRRFQIAAKQLQVDSTAEALAQLFAKLNEGKPEN